MVSHNILKNELLARLTDRVDMIAARQCPRAGRIEALSQFLLHLQAATPNVQRACAVWRREPETGRSVPLLVNDLVSRARSLPDLAPTDSFPSDARVGQWLASMGLGIEQLETMDSGRADSALTPATVTAFWNAAIDLVDFVHNLDIEVPEFWKCFSERQQ